MSVILFGKYWDFPKWWVVNEWLSKVLNQSKSLHQFMRRLCSWKIECLKLWKRYVRFACEVRLGSRLKRLWTRLSPTGTLRETFQRHSEYRAPLLYDTETSRILWPHPPNYTYAPLIHCDNQRKCLFKYPEGSLLYPWRPPDLRHECKSLLVTHSSSLPCDNLFTKFPVVSEIVTPLGNFTIMLWLLADDTVFLSLVI